MGSQFVDLNADGHLDYLSATFDGSPHVSWGGADGFAEPARLEDAAGERLLVSYYWDYDENAHLTTGRSMPDGKPRNLRGISDVAMDWDGDGDLDLVFADDNSESSVWLNDGNETFTDSGQNISSAGKSEAIVLADFTGDGALDLVTVRDGQKSRFYIGGIN